MIMFVGCSAYFAVGILVRNGMTESGCLQSQVIRCDAADLGRLTSTGHCVHFIHQQTLLPSLATGPKPAHCCHETHSYDMIQSGHANGALFITIPSNNVAPMCLLRLGYTFILAWHLKWRLS
eukprot:4343356-Amphidinium_carterae.1